MKKPATDPEERGERVAGIVITHPANKVHLSPQFRCRHRRSRRRTAAHLRIVFCDIFATFFR